MAMPTPNPTIRCKLCAAFGASGLPTAGERGLSGAESFTKSPDICDACLAQDYTTKPRISLEQWFGISVGSVVAMVAGAMITISHRSEASAHFRSLPPFERLLASMFIVSLVIAVPCMLIAWSAIHALLWLGKWRARDAIRKELDENAAADAERFHWLAEWAAMTGHDRFRMRMLKQAAALGYGALRQ